MPAPSPPRLRGKHASKCKLSACRAPAAQEGLPAGGSSLSDLLHELQKQMELLRGLKAGQEAEAELLQQAVEAMELFKRWVEGGTGAPAPVGSPADWARCAWALLPGALCWDTDPLTTRPAREHPD